MTAARRRPAAEAAADLTWTMENGVVLAGDHRGDPTDPPVLFVHGGGQTRHTWARTMERVSALGWYAVCYDQRGHGDSDWAGNGDYHPERFAADLSAVAASLGALPVVVGASLGGTAAILAQGEADRPLFRALALVDVTPRVETGGVDRIVGFMRSHMEDGFGSVEEAAAVIAAYLPHRPRPASNDGLAKNLRLDEDGRYRWHWDPQFILGGRPAGKNRHAGRLTDAARTLRLPVLLIRGDRSELVSEETAREFLAAVPQARYVNIAGARHMVSGDQNDVFGDAVVAFLDEVRDQG